ncbi:MAG TPA: hypothetical protein VFL87_09895, partial [Thermoleophilaceae bacterium]|nr:hypothetical protein [Thermoleophilaceae bacterium]
ELQDRTSAALEAAPRSSGPSVPVEEVDEVRIVSAWLAANDAHELPLDPAPGRAALSELVAAASAGSPRSYAAA